MKEKNYCEVQSQYLVNHEIYRLRVIEGLKVAAIIEKLGVSRSRVYHVLSTFEHENTQQAALMKKQGKEVTPADYKQLVQELAELKKTLAHERLRADFYEEMVAFGKEVYGIDLKKAGTK